MKKYLEWKDSRFLGLLQEKKLYTYITRKNYFDIPYSFAAKEQGKQSFYFLFFKIPLDFVQDLAFQRKKIQTQLIKRKKNTITRDDFQLFAAYLTCSWIN